jgi:hypothetical protein
MKLYTSILLLFLTYNTIAQSFNFEEAQKICAETGDEYQGIENWEVYHTDNDLPSGNKTVLCATYSKSLNELEFKAQEAEKPVFIETIAPLASPLVPNEVYNLSSLIRAKKEAICDCSTNCSISSCNELTFIVRGELNSMVIRDTINLMSFETSNSQFNLYDRISFSSCLVTPPYENLTIEKIRFKLYPQSHEENSILQLLSIQALINYLNYDFVNKVIPDSFISDDKYVVSPPFFIEFPIFEYINVKVLNPNLMDNNLNENFYYDIVPQDSTQQNTIDIIMTDVTNFAFQRNAQLRGALVSSPGNDSLRHNVNLINDGANLCLSVIVDLIFGGENEFRYKSGSVNFANNWSCMQFKDQAKLIVNKNAYFHYGNNGIGMLSMRPGSSIVIEDNATLYFDGELIMPDNNESNISIILNENQTLEFSSSSKITTFLPLAKLTIYMKGGNLNILKLDSKYHKYLDIIYQNEEPITISEITAYPNPTSNVLEIHVPASVIGHTFKIFDHIGRLRIAPVDIENQITSLDVSDLDNGIYFASFSNGELLRFIVNK